MQIKILLKNYWEKVKEQYIKMTNKSYYKWIVAGLFLLCASGLVDKGLNIVVKDKLDKYNQAMIAGEIKDVRGTFIILSEIEAGLAILKSAEAGFTFIVELKTQFGNIIEPLHRMVNNAWMVSFASLCSLGLIEIFYKLTDKLGNFFLSGLLLVYFLLLLFDRSQKNIFKSILVAGQQVLIIVVVFCYVILPVYLLVSGVVLKGFADPHKEKVDSDIKTHHAGLLIGTNESYKEKAGRLSTRLDKEVPKVKEHLHSLASLLPVHIAIHLLLYLLMPILFPVFFYYGIRFAVAHYFRERR